MTPIGNREIICCFTARKGVKHMKKKKGKRLFSSVLSAAMILSAVPALPPVLAAEEIVAFTDRVSKESDVFTYHRDFSKGLENFVKVSSDGTLEAGESSASMSGNGIFIDQNSVSVKNTEVEFTFNPKNVSCDYGVILRYVSPQEYLYVGPASQNNQHYTNWGVYNQNGKVADISDAGFILDGRTTPYKIKVRAVENVITVFIDNEVIYSKAVNNITQNAGKIGFRTTRYTGMDVYEFTQRDAQKLQAAATAAETASISSEAMTVSMDGDFPRVISYTLKSGSVVPGQETPLYYVEINNRIYDNARVTSKASSDGMIYHMEIPEENSSDIRYAFDVSYTVTGNVLEMKLLHIQDEKNPIYTINFPEQSMVSMASTAPNAQLRVNNFQAETKSNLSARAAQGGFSETSLAVLSCDNAAAAISGESYKNRKEIAYKTTDCGDHTSTGLWLNEFTYRGVDGEIEIREPRARAAVVGDSNSDGKIDYQDGAIALRDLCMERKTGADVVTSTWPMIAMNVGSEAQYPFLRILDNIKKVSLATDGFGQNVIIKGYQSEGHDASHPDFANYNQRAGGLEDFNTLLDCSEDYNAKVGIHINHTDVYPEAPQYGKLASSLGAWSWYDSSVGTIRENDDLDKSENGLDGRLAKLFDTDTQNRLDTVYVDVFFGTRWPMYKLVDNINRRNIVLGTEYVDEMVSYSAFAHHIGSDFGGAGNLVRFVNHNQADIFTSHQLFRGADSRNNEQIGINGWQGAKNLNTALTAFYTKILPNKYLANFPVMQYENDTKAVLGTGGEVVTQMVNGVNVITKDGKKIAEGNLMFIPWNPKAEEKIYHYNPSGGTSTWDLPDSWGTVSSVKLYRLSDKGKTLADTLTVSGRKVTIQAEAGTGYVLYPGQTTPDMTSADTMEWSTGSPVKDMGFDSQSFRYWKKDVAADHIVIENNALGNSHLYIKGTKAGEVSQEITGLIPGQSYSASVWAITDDGRKASIKVDNAGTVLENYMTRSNVTYGYHHNDKYQTNAQRMSVRFTAVSDTATLTLAAEPGSSASSVVDFDDVRVMKCGLTDPGKHTYFEDFENVDQGLGIFVSTESDQSHLAQRNPVNPEYTPDVISGTYSLKVRAGDYMRTIPSTVRFLPETEYTVRLEYKAGTANAFTLGIRSDKASEAGDTEHAVLATAASTLGNMAKGTLEVKFTTGAYDDYYLDITRNAGTEYSIDNVSIDGTKPMNATTLGELIADANALKESDYTPDSWKAIREAVTQAEALLRQENPDQEDIITVYRALDAALYEAVKYADREQKDLLAAQVNALKALPSGDYIADFKWLTLQYSLKDAETLLKDAKATAPQIEEMLITLESVRLELQPVVDRRALLNVLAKAGAVDRNTVVDGQELQTFLSALEEASALNSKAGVTAQEISSACAKLTAAYEAIVLKDTPLGSMIFDVLENLRAEREYFTDENWTALQEAKNQLEALRTSSGVSVSAYFAILEKLNAALAGRQNTPVLTDSLKLDPGSFTVTCDNENPLAGSEGPVSLAFDNDPDTFWHSNYTPAPQALPATIDIDLGSPCEINRFSYLCRSGGGRNGMVTDYDLYYMNAASGQWVPLVEGGSFNNDLTVEKVSFKPVQTQKVRFVVKEGVGGFGSAAELSVYKKITDMNALQLAISDFDALDRDLYTPESLAELEKQIQRARMQITDVNTSQEAADLLLRLIERAEDALVPVPTQTDLRVLQACIRDADTLPLKDYKNTEAFAKALTTAKAVLASPSSQKDARDAALTLYAAQKALVKADTSQPDKPSALLDLSKAVISPIPDMAYTGKAITPQPRVSLNGKALTNGTDYVLTFLNNTNPGKASVRITGKGSYTGSCTAFFRIVPKKAVLSKALKYKTKALKLSWKRDKKSDGYQIFCSTSRKFSGKVKKISVTKNKTTSSIIRSLKSKKTYYVRIRSYKTIDGKKAYGAFSKTKKVKVK